VQAPVARAHSDLVALPAGILVEQSVHRRVLLGDGRIARIEVGDLFADEGRRLDAEEFFPRPVDAEVAAVSALEEHGHGERIDQLERCVERSGRFLPARPF